MYAFSGTSFDNGGAAFSTKVVGHPFEVLLASDPTVFSKGKFADVLTSQQQVLFSSVGIGDLELKVGDWIVFSKPIAARRTAVGKTAGGSGTVMLLSLAYSIGELVFFLLHTCPITLQLLADVVYELWARSIDIDDSTGKPVTKSVKLIMKRPTVQGRRNQSK